MTHKAGFVNIIGRPNAGKSTLMNRLVGEHLSIINPKVQTTRHRITGIVNTEDYQIVYSDTPGVLEPKYALQNSMMSFVKEAISDADIILLLIDIHDRNADFFGLEKPLKELKIPKIGVLNKIDLSDQDKVEEMSAMIKERFSLDEVIPISALHDFGVDVLKRRVEQLIPESPPYYDKEALTDRPMRFFVEERIRERILTHYKKEVPYSVEVQVEEYKDEPEIVRISAVIYVMRKSQKGILIGHQGAGLKRVGTEARKSLEKFLDKKVFLKLYVKVDEDWRNKENKLKNYGYKG
jgi:GTP-binding protein Era